MFAERFFGYAVVVVVVIFLGEKKEEEERKSYFNRTVLITIPLLSYFSMLSPPCLVRLAFFNKPISSVVASVVRFGVRVYSTEDPDRVFTRWWYRTSRSSSRTNVFANRCERLHAVCVYVYFFILLFHCCLSNVINTGRHHFSPLRRTAGSGDDGGCYFNGVRLSRGRCRRRRASVNQQPTVSRRLF